MRGVGLFTNSGSQQGPHIGIWKNVDHDINSKGAQAVQGRRLHGELAAEFEKNGPTNRLCN